MSAPTDHRNNEITIGSKVAFNYQGQVGVGIVKDVKRYRGTFQSTWRFYVEREVPIGSNRWSEITSPYNLLVLFEN